MFAYLVAEIQYIEVHHGPVHQFVFATLIIKINIDTTTTLGLLINENLKFHHQTSKVTAKAYWIKDYLNIFTLTYGEVMKHIIVSGTLQSVSFFLIGEIRICMVHQA